MQGRMNTFPPSCKACTSLLFSPFSHQCTWTKSWVNNIISFPVAQLKGENWEETRALLCWCYCTPRRGFSGSAETSSLTAFYCANVFTTGNLVDTHLLPASSNTFAVLRPFPTSSFITSWMISAPMKAYSSGRDRSVSIKLFPVQAKTFVSSQMLKNLRKGSWA